MTIRSTHLVGASLTVALALLGWQQVDDLSESGPDSPARASATPHGKAPQRTLAVRLDTPEPTFQTVRMDAAHPVDAGGAWWPRDVLVELAPGVDATALAEELGVELAGRARYAPLAVLRADSAESATALRRSLTQESRVLAASRHGVVMGAHKGGGKPSGTTATPADLSGYQVQHAGLVAPTSGDLSAVVVAVLDTGVAYEDNAGFRQAPSLAASPIVAPFDAIEGDGHPNDDHQHGTHIASIIGSNGVVQGIAPGVGLMPVKVLDGNNRGTELGLIDGILHAVENGADIINMSLAFAPGYVPSRALVDALQRARDAGVLPIAAVGNNGVQGHAFPAASPLAVAVSPSYRTSTKKGDRWEWSPYRNLGTSVDLLMPGGNMGTDADRDGVVDGILAESFAPGRPGELGYWLMAGSSQAAAVASGAAAWLIAAGVDSACVVPALQTSTTSLSYQSVLASGQNMSFGIPVIAKAIETGLACTAAGGPDGIYAVLSPYLVVGGTKSDALVPTVRVDLFQSDGSPFRPVQIEVYADLHTPVGSERLYCYDQASNNHCVLTGTAIDRFAPDGSEAPLAFTVELGNVRTTSQVYHPGLALMATDALDAAIGKLDADPNRANLVLGYWNEAGLAPELGEQGEVVEGFAVFNSGTGISTSPFGFYGNLAAWSELADVGSSTLALGQSVESPDGTADVLTLHEVSLDGAGIATSPFGFLPRWTALSTELSGTGISTSPFGLWSPKLTGDGVLMGSSTLGASLTSRLSDGGWTTKEGSPPATMLAASDAFNLANGQPVAQPGLGAEGFVP